MTGIRRWLRIKDKDKPKNNIPGAHITIKSVNEDKVISEGTTSDCCGLFSWTEHTLPQRMVSVSLKGYKPYKGIYPVGAANLIMFIEKEEKDNNNYENDRKRKKNEGRESPHKHKSGGNPSRRKNEPTESRTPE